ncbi:hypothetical protein RJ639_021372 [Escallonia herrerae]|uniref:Uncharacterized protein n=1 Tax=Escallonia herrerae TaxID=1293975 RepID=A0AA88V368_9ASTE|nr:hypothetical protein RJ639_021372 [Escallonia herrerae]
MITTSGESQNRISEITKPLFYLSCPYPVNPSHFADTARCINEKLSARREDSNFPPQPPPRPTRPLQTHRVGDPTGLGSAQLANHLVFKAQRLGNGQIHI